MIRIAPALLLLLAACSASETADRDERQAVEANSADMVVPQGNDASAAKQARPGLDLAPDGLTVVLGNGATRQLAFDGPRKAVMQAAEAAIGKPDNQTSNPDCPPGPLDSVDFAGGLTLFFQDARFVGWDVDDAHPGRFTTMSGVGIGTTRRDMERSITIDVEETSLGVEFRSGGMSGLLSASGETGRVTQLWAGTTCLFR